MSVPDLPDSPSTGPTWLAGCVLNTRLALSTSSAPLLRFLLAAAADMRVVDERQVLWRRSVGGETKSGTGAYALSVLWIRTTTSGTDSASDSCFPLSVCSARLSAALKQPQALGLLLCSDSLIYTSPNRCERVHLRGAPSVHITSHDPAGTLPVPITVVLRWRFWECPP